MLKTAGIPIRVTILALIAHIGKPDPGTGVMVGIVAFLMAGTLVVIAANKARSL